MHNWYYINTSNATCSLSKHFSTLLLKRSECIVQFCAIRVSDALSLTHIQTYHSSRRIRDCEKRKATGWMQSPEGREIPTGKSRDRRPAGRTSILKTVHENIIEFVRARLPGFHGIRRILSVLSFLFSCGRLLFMIFRANYCQLEDVVFFVVVWMHCEDLWCLLRDCCSACWTTVLKFYIRHKSFLYYFKCILFVNLIF